MASIKLCSAHNLFKISWASVWATYVYESTGVFMNTKIKAHLGGWAKKVVISALSWNTSATARGNKNDNVGDTE